MADITKRLIPNGVYDPFEETLNWQLSRALTNRLHIDCFRT